MRTREEIRSEMKEIFDLISELKADYIELQIEDLRLCDESVWYKEECETVVLKKRPLKTTKELVGRVYWIEEFTDIETNETVSINRSREVMRNGTYHTYVCIKDKRKGLTSNCPNF